MCAPAAAAESTSARIGSTSHGAARAVGPGRPDCAWNIASSSRPGAIAGLSTFAAHLVNERRLASWSGISCRCPKPRPRYAVGISLVRHSTGMLAPYAVSKAAEALSTPGAGDHTAHPNSTGRLRVTERHVGARLLVAGTEELDPVPSGGERLEQRVGLHPGQAEDGVDAVREQAIDERFGGRADGCCGGLRHRWASWLDDPLLTVESRFGLQGTADSEPRPPSRQSPRRTACRPAGRRGR